MARTPPLIALEEHFFSNAVPGSVEGRYAEQFKAIPGIEAQLRDLSSRRLADMSTGSVTLQVVSHAPGSLDATQCRNANDQLASAVKQHPARFAGFAVLPVTDPQAGADELRRCIRELKFVGALVDNHLEDGTFYDGDSYDVFWRTAEDLDVPIYLHPTWPSSTLVRESYSGNFTQGAERSLGASGWGWHSETGLHVLRLFAAGVFDKHPRLKIIIGHFGEMLPFMHARIANLSRRWGNIERDWRTVWSENIWITTSGVWSLDPLRCLLGNTKVERILYSVDYPFEKNENGLRWVEELKTSGLVSNEELEMICYKNAERLLGVNASTFT